MASRHDISVAIQMEPITTELLSHEGERGGQDGAVVTFAGVIRNHNVGKVVTGIEYECFEPMARKEIARIAAEALERHSASSVLVIHRIGFLNVGEAAVFVRVLSPHRREAFVACMEIMDRLKAVVPIWKKEFYADGSHAWPRCQHPHHGSSSQDRGVEL